MLLRRAKEEEGDAAALSTARDSIPHGACGELCLHDAIVRVVEPDQLFLATGQRYGCCVVVISGVDLHQVALFAVMHGRRCCCDLGLSLGLRGKGHLYLCGRVSSSGSVSSLGGGGEDLRLVVVTAGHYFLLQEEGIHSHSAGGVAAVGEGVGVGEMVQMMGARAAAARGDGGMLSSWPKRG